MIYDRLAVTLLTALASEDRGSTNAVLARYVVEHAAELGDLSVRRLAEECSVGAGSVSRFVRDVGFESFDDLRAALAESRRDAGLPVGVVDAAEEATAVQASIQQVAGTIDRSALARLAADIASHPHVSAYGPLKAQGAAVSLQTDLLMLGRVVDTATSYAEQLDRIARASRDELVVVFSYTGGFFDGRDLTRELSRLDRPRIWVVTGSRRPLPSYVADRLAFDSDLSRTGHPFQLEFAAHLIAQEYAALTSAPN